MFICLKDIYNQVIDKQIEYTRPDPFLVAFDGCNNTALSAAIVGLKINLSRFLGVSTYFKEPLDTLLTSEEPPATPRIFLHPNDLFSITIDGLHITAKANLEDGVLPLTALMAVYFIFSLEYEVNAKNTLHFIERMMLIKRLLLKGKKSSASSVKLTSFYLSFA